MGRKKLEKNEAVLEDKPKKRGRPKVSEGAPSSPKLEKKKKVKSIYDEDGEILSLDDIKNSLLKKAKSSGIIDQSDIYDALNQFDLDDDTIADLINFFKENGIEVIIEQEPVSGTHQHKSRWHCHQSLLSQRRQSELFHYLWRREQ